MIHKTAIVDKKAEISGKAIIGPYCIVGPKTQKQKDIPTPLKVSGS